MSASSLSKARRAPQRWLLVGHADGSFTRRPGPYPLAERAEPDDGHTVVWYGKSISQRFDGAIRGDDYASTNNLSPEAR